MTEVEREASRGQRKASGRSQTWEICSDQKDGPDRRLLGIQTREIFQFSFQTWHDCKPRDL